MNPQPTRLPLCAPIHWQGCATDNIQISPDGLHIKTLAPGCRGILVSPLLDSRQEEMPWHRLIIDGDIPDGAGLELTVYASDSPTLTVEDRAVFIGEYIADASIPITDKLAAMAPLRALSMITPRDVLLHSVKGRYVWFALMFTGQVGITPVLGQVTAIFPRQSLVSYLPEVYQQQEEKDDFLTRYLSIFGTFIEDMERNIDRVSTLMDTDENTEELLRWMSGWLAVEDATLWREDNLRELLRNATRLYGIRGTPRSIVEVVRLYTGSTPFLTEGIDTLTLAEDAPPTTARTLRRLYGEDPNGFTVLVSDEDVPTERHVQELQRILDSFSPAHARARLVVLRPYIFLDQHSYLGKNTWLSATREMSLDGFGTLPYVALLQDGQEQGKQS